MGPSEVQADIAVLGGGPAGYVAALVASRLGASVALVEEREVGGTCLNRGCIPTKALLKTAEAAQLLKKAREFGIDVKYDGLHWDVAAGRKDRIVKSLRMGLEHLLDKSGVRVIRDKGSIVSPNRLVVQTGEAEIAVVCRKLIITTGSAPALPDIPGIRLPRVITSDEALDLKELPASTVIIGAGAIGLEFATMFSAAGVKVSVVEIADGILPMEDREIAAELLKSMKRQGIAFKLSSRVMEIKDAGGTLEVAVEEKGNTVALNANMVLVAVGRKLLADAPGILSLGVRTEKGAIVVNDRMETGVPGVYAAGDAVGGRLLAHLAFAEGRTAARNAMGVESSIDYDTVPSCVYTQPEVAAVGLSEEECKARGIEVKVGRFDFRNNGRALCLGERDGFVKVVVDSKTHVLLGARILGPQATEMISEMTLAVALKARAELLADMIHPHPALSEAIMEACGDALSMSIHKA